MTKQTIKNALEKIGVTDGQKQVEFFAAFAGKRVSSISDSDVCAALNKLGVTDEKAQGDFFAAVREPEIMNQELDKDELDAVAGGAACDDNDADEDNCVQQYRRNIVIDGQKNCASTVEYVSICSLNDSCISWAIIYR